MLKHLSMKFDLILVQKSFSLFFVAVSLYLADTAKSYVAAATTNNSIEQQQQRRQ
jgi:hypothetical protein